MREEEIQTLFAVPCLYNFKLTDPCKKVAKHLYSVFSDLTTCGLKV